MKLNFFTFLIIFVLLIPSCGDKGMKTNFINFPKNIDFSEYEPTNVLLEGSNNPTEISAIDSILIILDSKDVNSFIKAYSTINYKCISTFGKRGRGPNEFYGPAYHKVDKDHDLLWFIDLPNKLFYAYKIQDIKKNEGELKPEIETPVNNDLMPFFDYYILKDTSILLPTSKDSSLLTQIDFDGNIVNEFGKTNNSIHIENSLARNYFYSKTFIYSEKDTKVACFYKFIDKIETYSLLSKESKVLYGLNFKDINPKIMKGGNVNIDYYSFSRVKTFDDLLFSVYRGKGKRDVNGEKITEDTSTILVFNWELKPIAILSFPFSIIDFAINNRNIYLLTSDLDKQLVVYPFNFSKIKY